MTQLKPTTCAALLALVSSCAPPPPPLTSLDVMISDAQTNEIAARSKYGDAKDIRISGTIGKIGVLTFEQQKASGTIYPVPFPFRNFDVEMESKRVGYPYLYLLGEHEASGGVLCYIGQDRTEEFEVLRKGQQVTVLGHFQEYVQDGDRINAVLHGCRLSE